ncbi:MAG: type II TA system antitoxin MqsA family protein [Gemmatimonadaceae bacterium]
MTSDSLLDGHLHRQCGGRYARATETVTIRVSGMSAVVERTFFRCDSCGDERRTVEQREHAEQAAVAAMRDEHGLLKPKEIRQRRERLGVTTAQFGDLLFGVPQGIVEGWEKGRYVQNPQVDALIRSLDDPDTLQYRAARGGVTLPPPPGSEPVDAAGETTDPSQAGGADH